MWQGRSAPLSTSFRLGISLLDIRLVRRGVDKLADRALTVNRFSLVSQPEVAGQGHCNAAVSCIGLLPLPAFHLQLDLSGTGSLSHCQLGSSPFTKPSSDIIAAAFFALFILSVRLGWPRLISSGLLDPLWSFQDSVAGLFPWGGAVWWDDSRNEMECDARFPFARCPGCC